MNYNSDHKIFLLVSLKKLMFFVINSKKKNLYKKEILINDLSNTENLDSLNNFLKQNIFDIERNLGEFVNNIFLISDYNEFFSVDLSIKNKLENDKFEISYLNSLLAESKSQFKKTLGDNEIIHMKINKYIIDKTDYSFLPDNLNCNNLSIEVRFICLPKILIQNFKKILNNYEISISKILSYKYLCSFKTSENDDIFNVAENILNGLNQNEVFLINKSIQNKGFFEKFFNFFN
jgi:hypothetical protein